MGKNHPGSPQDRMRILVVCPHPKEPLRSIGLFSEMLLSGLGERGFRCKRICPPDFFAKPVSNNSGWRRLLVYLDKLFLFPLYLRKEVKRNKSLNAHSVVHIADQGDALYTQYLQDIPHLVTCHDALGMRSAFGLEPLNLRRGLPSRFFQRAILSGLRKALRIACVSDATQTQIADLGVSPENCRVIHNGLNHPYRPLPAGVAQQTLSQLFHARGIPTLRSGYILHVGGNSWYKNRKGVILSYAHLTRVLGNAPSLILAGRALSEELSSLIEDEGIENNVFLCPDCTWQELNALYQEARFLYFPSVQEGFGWPVIEAQACGSLVVTSDRAPMNAVGGDAAIFCEAPPKDGVGFQQWMRSVAERTLIPALEMDEEDRKSAIQNGLINATRYTPEKMVSAYISLYLECIKQHYLSISKAPNQSLPSK